VNAVEAKERATFITVLLSERKFFVNLIASMLKKLLDTARALSRADAQQAKAFPSFQNDPFLAKEYMKMDEENVGKSTPPTLR
jgi:DNA mismatch repair ATPase MutS